MLRISGMNKLYYIRNFGIVPSVEDRGTDGEDKLTS